jgi:cytochrome c-type biogenesis protein CcmH/NrfG
MGINEKIVVLWIVLTVATALVASALTIFVVRRHDAQRGRAATTTAGPWPPHMAALPWLVLGVAALGLAGGVLYVAAGASNPPPDSQLAADLLAKGTQTAPANHPVSDVDSMIAGLEAKLQQEPNNPEGWWMLGWSYMRLGRPARP